jgi:signal transduction histidine kinase
LWARLTIRIGGNHDQDCTDDTCRHFHAANNAIVCGRRCHFSGGDDYEATLTAATRSLGDRMEIRIRDNSTGILPEVREKMFSHFFTTKLAGEGAGLGPSISHDVKQHGGTIEVET